MMENLEMFPILHTFPCQSHPATFQRSSPHRRLRGMPLYPSGYAKSISVWPQTDSWYIIGRCGASFLHQDKTLRSVTRIYNNRKLFLLSVNAWLTFIGGDAHIDSCSIMRETFSWRVSFSAASWVTGPQSRVISQLFSDLQMQPCPSTSFTTLYLVCLLSYSMCVHQKPQWVEGRGGNGYWWNVAEHLPPLSNSGHHSSAV